ncbi:MAG: hypothetical protein AB7F35_26410 [Acetobacteraceae bacterium]
MSQVYLLGEIVAAFTATGRTLITVNCARCQRHGRLSLRRLLAEHGPDARGPDVLNAIAADCARQGTRSVHDVCGVRFPEMREVFLGPLGRCSPMIKDSV